MQFSFSCAGLNGMGSESQVALKIGFCTSSYLLRPQHARTPRDVIQELGAHSKIWCLHLARNMLGITDRKAPSAVFTEILAHGGQGSVRSQEWHSGSLLAKVAWELSDVFTISVWDGCLCVLQNQ